MWWISSSVDDIIVKHLDDSCFQVFDIPKSPFINKIPIFISAKKELYGVSLSLYKGFVSSGDKIVDCVVLTPEYDEKLDLFMQNYATNTVIKLHKVKQKYPNPKDVDVCEFDHNQMDLMYLIDLNDDDALDIRRISEETAKIKKNFDIMILTKTLEENFLIQKFFDTNINVIKYKQFQAKITGHTNLMDKMFCEGRSDEYYQKHVFADYTIKCRTISEMNDVLDKLGINHKNLKTTRLNFDKVRKVFE